MKKKLFALKSAKKDTWIKIGVEGEWEGHENGTFHLDKKIFEKIIENFTKGNVDIVVDYEHSTLYEPKAVASGWIKKENIKIEDDALFVKIDWTPQAKKHIESKEYKYLSPVFLFATVDRVTGDNIGATLHSVALTNTPFLEELGAIANKQKNNNKEEEEMEKIQAKLDEANNKLANKEVKIQELEAKIKKLEETQTAQEVKMAEQEVETALSAGKINASQKAWALSYAQSDKKGFEDYLKNATPVQDLSGEAYANSSTANHKKADEAINMGKV